ncbi:MAG: UDP-N-acetylmuramoyl-L-alanyl-D-glutamate--2,6-diaminopimelate ligase [Myxococcota bacterium]
MPATPPDRPLRALLADLEVLDLDAPDPAALDRSVTRVTRDSREVDAATVFVAVRGAKVDGHDYAGRLAAAAVVPEAPVQALPGVVSVRVASTKHALAELAASLHGHPGRAMRVVGVTGTNGKTTVTTVLEQALHHLGARVGRVGTTGNAIDGVPRPGGFTTPEAPELQALLADMRDAGCSVVLMEASSIGLAQHRVDAIGFDVAVFTNLTRDHLDFHGTMAAYAEAKARLFRELLAPPRSDGVPRAILCADDPAHAQMGAPADRWTYGRAEGADLRIVAAALEPGGTAVTLATPDGEQRIHSLLVGRHNTENLAACYGALRSLGVAPADAVRALEQATGAPGRFERVPDPLGGRVVVVDYAHSEDAFEHALPTLRELVSGQVWIVFGCGGDRDRGKRPRMGEAAARLADRVVVTSDNPRSEAPGRIAEDILGGIDDVGRVHVELDREAAIRWVLARAAPGDGVLVAGKGHESTQEIDGVKRPFDDRAVARAALEAG